MGGVFDVGIGSNKAKSNTEGSSKGSVQANLRFKMLKQKLFGPEIEKIQLTLDSKMKAANDQIKSDLAEQLRKTEYKFSEKLVMVDEYLEMLDKINIRHKEFVKHLETIHQKIDEKIYELEQKVAYCQKQTDKVLKMQQKTSQNAKIYISGTSRMETLGLSKTDNSSTEESTYRLPAMQGSDEPMNMTQSAYDIDLAQTRTLMKTV